MIRQGHNLGRASSQSISQFERQANRPFSQILSKALQMFVIWGVFSTGSVQGDVLGDLFPIAEMQDVATLNLKRKDTGYYSIKGSPSRQFKYIDISFESFRWAGETWRHKATVLLPDQPNKTYEGSAVVLLDERPRELVDATLLLGIPVLVVRSGNPGKRYGIKAEGELMGYGQRKFLATGDQRWAGYTWLGKVATRAVTAAASIKEMNATKFLVSGCSKRGVATWIAAAVDDRIVGAVARCWHAGNSEAWVKHKAERWGLDYQPKKGAGVRNRGTVAPAFVTTAEQQELWLNHELGLQLRSLTDPYLFRDRLEGKKVLYIAGTNDPLFPATSSSVFLPHMSDSVQPLIVPNKGHVAGKKNLIQAYRMWVAHTFAGREIGQIGVSAKRTSDSAEIVAEIQTPYKIKSVKLWSMSDGLGAYFKRAWKATAMQRTADGKFRASINTPEGMYTGYFVELVDKDPESTKGVVTTQVFEFTP